MKDARREIVEAVARGELTPEEAAARLEETEARGVPAGSPSHPTTQAAAPPDGLTAVRILSDFGDVRVYGDASVAGAVADGSHEAMQEGSTLVIKTRWLDDGGWAFRDRRPRINGSARNERVDIRMNPGLPLELRVRAGVVRVEGVEGPIRSEVQAGEVRIDGFRAPVDIDVAAGEVRARGRLDQGDSRVRCKAGHVRLELEPGSSVRVRARTTMGQVDLDDESHFGIAGRAQERVIGDGAASLDIEASVGQVEVRTGA